MPSFPPPPHTPFSPFFPPPNFGTAQVPYTTYRPICYEKGLIKIDIRVDPSGQVFPDLPTMSKLVNVDYPQAPIRVSLWNWAPNASAAEMCLRSGVAHVLSGHFKFVFGLLWRWHSARLDLKLIEALVMHICDGDSRKIPIGRGPGILESVKFTRAGDIKDVQLVDTFLSRLSGQQMHELCIGVSDSAKPFSILRTFRSIHYAFLTRLELDGFAVSSFQVHELLIETLNIMECVVSDLTGPFPGTCKAVVPNLRRLKLDLDMIDFQDTRNTGAVFRLLEGIVAPDLIELSLGYENVWDDYRYDEFYALCRPRLQKLHLRKMNMNERQLFDCLSRHPELEEFVLDMQYDHWDGRAPPVVFTQRTCKYLSFDSQGESLCPDLESLSVRDNCIEATGCFGKMVKNRVKHKSLSEVVVFGDVLCLEDRRTLNSLAAKGLRVNIGEDFVA